MIVYVDPFTGDRLFSDSMTDFQFQGDNGMYLTFRGKPVVRQTNAMPGSDESTSNTHGLDFVLDYKLKLQNYDMQ